ncbi:MAG: nucleotidyltransferase family protein [Candidatus Hodarchaeales archaeon]
MDLKTAIVLAGGKGMRLRPYTEDLPKPLIEIRGKPILYWIVKWLEYNGVRRMVLGVAHKKEKIFNWVDSISGEFNLEIITSEHFIESGTGGGIKHAIKNANIEDKYFLAMNGDELTDVSLNNFFRFHTINNKIGTILATPLRSNFGVLDIGEENLITAFKEKPIIDQIFINSGVYLFNPEIEPYLPWEGNIERTAFVKLAEERKLVAFRYFGFWRTINTEKDLDVMRKEIEYLGFSK